MATKLVTGYEVHPHGIRVWADIPKRRNGEHNEGAFAKALLVLGELTPDAYDPPEPPGNLDALRLERSIVRHDVARAAQRDGVLLRWVGGTGQRYATKLDAVANGEQVVSPAEDDEGEPIPGFGCATGVCNGD